VNFTKGLTVGLDVDGSSLLSLSHLPENERKSSGHGFMVLSTEERFDISGSHGDEYEDVSV
jgi:hypothetical protein